MIMLTKFCKLCNAPMVLNSRDIHLFSICVACEEWENEDIERPDEHVATLIQIRRDEDDNK